MTTKFDKKEYPHGLSAEDFKCHGPVATKDTEFAGMKLADMGCFQQEEKGKTKEGDARTIDSNKYYHCAVVSANGKWYMYVEFGRVGNSPTFQFTECDTESEAQALFEKQCKTKNTNRGMMSRVAGMDMFVPKPKKNGELNDLYSVRQLASRDTGLPDARNLAADDGTVAVTKTKSNGKKKKANRCDAQTSKLMRDLIGGTVQHARTTLVGGAVPAQTAINEGRDILQSAKKRLVKVGSNVDDQVNDADLKTITYALYSRIPKIKPLNAPESDWILSSENIFQWENDIDAFETALKTGSFEVEDDANDPMAGMPMEMEWLDPKSDLGEYVASWWHKATKDRHSGVGRLKISNLWKIQRHGDDVSLTKSQKKIVKEMGSFNQERPLHQK